MEAYESTVSTVPSRNVIHPVECAPDQTNLELRYVRDIAYPQLTTDKTDLRFHDWGNFYIATQGQQVDDITLGELWVSYHLELYKPKTALNTGYSNTYEIIAPTQAAPLGTGHTPLTTNNAHGIYLDSANNWIRLKTGAWLVTMVVTASTTATCGTPSLPTGGYGQFLDISDVPWLGGYFNSAAGTEVAQIVGVASIGSGVTHLRVALTGGNITRVRITVTRLQTTLIPETISETITMEDAKTGRKVQRQPPAEQKPMGWKKVSDSDTKKRGPPPEGDWRGAFGTDMGPDEEEEWEAWMTHRPSRARRAASVMSKEANPRDPGV